MSMALYGVAMLGLSASAFYSKIMFKFDKLNPMEAVYVIALIQFILSLILLTAYIKRWCTTYKG